MCLPLTFLLPCVSSLDDVAAVLLMGIAAELVVGELLEIINYITGMMAGLLKVISAVGNRP